MTSQALATQGVQFKRGDGGSPESFALVGEVVSFTGPGGAASIIDVSSLDSTAREKRLGLPDEGQFQMSCNLVPSDTQQIGLRNDRTARTLRNFQLHLTDSPATIVSFSAYVTEFSISGGVDDKIGASITLEITGTVTWS